MGKASAVETPDDPTVDPVRRPGALDRGTWILIAILLTPLVVEAVHLVADFSGARATTDNALNELVVRDLFDRVPQLGPYARFDWSHPGPLLYFTLLGPYHLFGGTSAAMAVGALLVNGAGIATMIAIGRRWGGFAFAVPLAMALGIIIVRLPHGYLADPWNPSVTAVPFGAFLLLAWAAACGDRWALPAAAFVGSFCAQTHIGYASLVAPLLAWAVWRVWRQRAEPGHEAGGRALAATAIVLAAVWALPVFQQLTADSGNLANIVDYFRTSPEPGHTLVDGWRLVAAQFALGAEWLVGFPPPTTAEPVALGRSPIPLLLVGFAIAAWYGGRRRGPAREFAILMSIAVVVGVISLSRTLGPLYDYRLKWIWVLAGIATAFTIATGVRAVLDRAATDRGRAMVTALVAVGTAAVVTLSAVGIANALDSELVDQPLAVRTDELERQVRRALPDRPGVVVLRPTSYGGYLALPGLVLRLTEAGIPVRVEGGSRQRELTFGSRRLYDGEPVRAVLLVTAGEGIAPTTATPGARRIAFVSGRVGARGPRPPAAIRGDNLAVFTIPVASAGLDSG